jgi:hypothetical protein
MAFFQQVFFCLFVFFFAQNLLVDVTAAYLNFFLQLNNQRFYMTVTAGSKGGLNILEFVNKTKQNKNLSL